MDSCIESPPLSYVPIHDYSQHRRCVPIHDYSQHRKCVEHPSLSCISSQLPRWSPFTTFSFQSQSIRNNQGFINCSPLNQNRNPTQMIPWLNSPIQNHALCNPASEMARFGNIGPGPSASGAQALPTIVAIDPSTCAHTNAKLTWKRVSVCSNIMPIPQPCIVSSTPSHNHKERPSRAPARGPPAQGTHCAMLEVPQSIWHHLGHPRPIAKMGRIQVCVRE